MIYTKKQRRLLDDFAKGKLRRINILSGSVRSGKTWISLVLWAFWILTMPKEGTYLMTAKTLKSLKRNCLDLLLELVGEKNFTYSLSAKEGFLFGRRLLFEGGNDVRAEGKIRGLTLTGAYVDELTLIPEDFFTMLLSRLSVENAKLFATTNPDHPRHYVKRKFLDRAEELDLYAAEFLIDDNEFLPSSYVEGLKKEYTGVFFERFILGKWVAADGVIYKLFCDDTKRFVLDTPPPIAFASVGVDFGGNKSATAFVLTGLTAGMKQVVTLDEFYVKETLSPAELEAQFVGFIKKNARRYRIYDAWCDSAESTLIRGLENAAWRENLGIHVRCAIKGKIVDRIRFFNNLMSHGRYFVLSHCNHTIDALCTAVWDEKRQEDRRLDDGVMNVDSLDALEYSVEYYMRDLLDMM